MGAMRTKPLKDWGNGKILREIKDDGVGGTAGIGYQVLNWDGIVSPVVHQFDRHKELNKYFYKLKGAKFLAEWNDKKLNLSLTATA